MSLDDVRERLEKIREFYASRAGTLWLSFEQGTKKGKLAGVLVGQGDNYIKVEYQSHPDATIKSPEEAKKFKGATLFVREPSKPASEINGKVDSVEVADRIITITYLDIVEHPTRLIVSKDNKTIAWFSVDETGEGGQARLWLTSDPLGAPLDKKKFATFDELKKYYEDKKEPGVIFEWR